MSWFKFCSHEYFVVQTGGSLRDNNETFILFFSATCIHCGDSKDVVERINNIHFKEIDSNTCYRKYSPTLMNRVYSKLKVVNKL